jgi:hypothetical protein
MAEAPTPTAKEAPTMSTFTASFTAASADAALAHIERHLAKCDGFATTGRIAQDPTRRVTSPDGLAGHFHIEVEDLGGDRDDCWVVLTSFGICPSADLGSVWEQHLGATA